MTSKAQKKPELLSQTEYSMLSSIACPHKQVLPRNKVEKLFRRINSIFNSLPQEVKEQLPRINVKHHEISAKKTTLAASYNYATGALPEKVLFDKRTAPISRLAQHVRNDYDTFS